MPEITNESNHAGLSPAKEMPIRQTIGHGYFRKPVPELQYFVPAKSLLDARKEAIVYVLANSMQAFTVVALVKRYVWRQTQGPQHSA